MPPAFPELSRVFCREAVRCTAVYLAVWCSLASLFLAGCAEPLRQEPDVLRLGLLIQESHFSSAPVVDVVQLAVDQVNEDGGLKLQDGRRARLELKVRAGFETPEQAVESMRELVYQERVSAVVGPSLSRNAIPVAEVAESVGVPMISPGSW